MYQDDLLIMMQIKVHCSPNGDVQTAPTQLRKSCDENGGQIS